MKKWKKMKKEKRNIWYTSYIINTVTVTHIVMKIKLMLLFDLLEMIFIKK